MYEQTLYKVIDHIKPHVIQRLNRSKKWEYGYNKESRCYCYISNWRNR